MACQEYTPTEWFDNTAPAINAVNLNHMEIGIKSITDCVNTEVIPRIADLEIELSQMLFSGMIIAYGKSIIPEGWALCDGTNGTPDLRDKFIMGGDLEAIGDTGGSADAVVVSHNHIFTGNALPPHQHSFDVFTNVAPSGNQLLGGVDGSNLQPFTVSSDSAGTPSGTISTEGQSGTDKNLPPYYKLAYIMKL